MLPPGVERTFEATAFTDGVDIRGDAVAIRSLQGFAAAALTGPPRGKRLSMAVRPEGGTFGLRLRAGPRLEGGTELRFDPLRGTVALRRDDLDSVQVDGVHRLQGVSGLDRPFHLEVVVTDALVDACIDGRRTLVARTAGGDTDIVGLFVRDGDVTFEGIRVRA